LLRAISGGGLLASSWPLTFLYLRCLFFQAYSERFNFLLLLRGSLLEILPLLRDGRFQFLHLDVFFEALVEQHRVHRVIAHSHDLAFVILTHQIGVYFFHFLGDQPIPRATGLEQTPFCGGR
jgi:hypothetical protein